MNELYLQKPKLKYNKRFQMARVDQRQKPGTQVPISSNDWTSKKASPAWDCSDSKLEQPRVKTCEHGRRNF